MTSSFRLFQTSSYRRRTMALLSADTEFLLLRIFAIQKPRRWTCLTGWAEKPGGVRLRRAYSQGDCFAIDSWKLHTALSIAPQPPTCGEKKRSAAVDGA